MNAKVQRAVSGKPPLLVKIRNIPVVVRRNGWVRSMRAYRNRLRELVQERRLNIDTMDHVTSEALNYDSECNDYEPVAYCTLEHIFLHLQPWRDNEVFLDYGCGKGRAVVVAATQPLRRVIGVELSPELSATARRNVRRARRHLSCRDIEIVTTDATAYEVPPQVSLIFFYNPFTGKTLSAVGERIHDSLRQHPRPLRIVYSHFDDEPNELEHWPWLTRIARIEIPSSPTDASFYTKLNWLVYQAG